MQSGRVSVGHPVDVSSGIMFEESRDVWLPGKMPLTWLRRYSTTLLETVGVFGPGWRDNYSAYLSQEQNLFRFMTPEGYAVEFWDREQVLSSGRVLVNLAHFHELKLEKGRYVVTRWNSANPQLERYIFNDRHTTGKSALAAIENEAGEAIDLLYDSVAILLLFSKDARGADCPSPITMLADCCIS